MWLRIPFILVILLLPAAAYADVIADPDSPSTPQEFSFFCEPYKRPFEAGKHYIPHSNPNCYYTLPQTARIRVLAIYKGEVGNATLVSSDSSLFSSRSALRTAPNNFGTPDAEQKFFAVAYGANSNAEILAGDAYFQSGEGTKPADATILPWVWGPKPASEFDPVVIIPGILGSWEKNGEWLIDPVLHTYDNLIDTLEANGYVLEQTLFPFPYNWQNSNKLTGFALKQKLEQVREICNCSYADVVTHSMGGLVAREYVQSDYYQNDIDQLFFLATPHLGATFAYLTWEAGIFAGEDILNPKFFILNRIFNNEARLNGFNSIFEYIKGRPVSSVQELLPIYNYLIDENGFREYPIGYPRNEFLENLNFNTFSSLLRPEIRILNLVASSGNNTPTSYSVIPSNSLPKWEHGEPISTHNGLGDETVPQQSAEWLGIDHLFPNTDHNLIASSSISLIFEILNNSTLEKQIGKMYSPLKDVDWSVLYIKLLSPIDVQIIGPDGKRLGKNFESNSELNEMSDAFYSGFNTHNEYAVIVNPPPGEYRVQTTGTENGGKYTIIANFIDKNGYVEAEISGTTTPAELIENQLILSIPERTLTLKKILPNQTQKPNLKEWAIRLIKDKINRLPLNQSNKDYLIKKSERAINDYFPERAEVSRLQGGRERGH